MLYDLDALSGGSEERDFFTLGGRPFAIGPITERDRREIASVDPEDASESWKRIIARMLSECNDAVPEVTDEVVAALLPVIAERIRER